MEACFLTIFSKHFIIIEGYDAGVFKSKQNTRIWEFITFFFHLYSTFLCIQSTLHRSGESPQQPPGKTQDHRKPHLTLMTTNSIYRI